jgi:hypothetical protein
VEGRLQGDVLGALCLGELTAPAVLFLAVSARPPARCDWSHAAPDQECSDKKSRPGWRRCDAMRCDVLGKARWAREKKQQPRTRGCQSRFALSRFHGAGRRQIGPRHDPCAALALLGHVRPPHPARRRTQRRNCSNGSVTAGLERPATRFRVTHRFGRLARRVGAFHLHAHSAPASS